MGAKGTVPLGFRLYLPEDWCADHERRRKAKIPADLEFQTKPALGGELVARAAGWKVRRAPVLGDQAYGNDAKRLLHILCGALASDSEPRSIAELVAELDDDAWQIVGFRDSGGEPTVSRFAFVRVIAAHPIDRDRQAPREDG